MLKQKGWVDSVLKLFKKKRFGQIKWRRLYVLGGRVLKIEGRKRSPLENYVKIMMQRYKQKLPLSNFYRKNVPYFYL
ncbi:MAG: hypothetical protein R2788_20270 [Saprospiraceae bacterium]